MGYDISDTELDEVIRALDTAPHGSKSAVLAHWAERLSPDPDDPMSTATLRRRIREREGKRKECAGRPKKIDRDVVRKIAQLKAKGMEMGLGDRELATEIAKEMAEREGLADASEISTSSINRILREELGFRRKKRYRKIQANFATQVQLLDFSRSKYVQVRDYDAEADDWLLEVSGKQLSYKDPEGAFRTWYAVLIDDHSRLRIARLFCDTGESALLGLTFLRWAWTRSKDAHPLRHPPRKLQTDYGAFRKSKRVQNAFDAMDGIELKGASKEAQGKVERQFRTLWQRFELPFAVEHGDGYQIHASDFNDLLHEYMIKDAERQHPLQPEYTRSQVYRGSIMRTPPLELDADMMRLAFDVYERTVNPHGQVSIDGDLYLCPETVEGIAIEPGMQVRVQRNAEGAVIGRLVSRHHQDAFTLEPWEQPSYGEYDGAPGKGTGSTKLDKLRTQADPETPAHEDLAPDDDDTGLGERSISVNVESDFEQPEEPSFKLPAGQAREYVGRRLATIGETYASARDIFDPLLGDVTQEQLDKVINEYLSHARENDTV